MHRLAIPARSCAARAARRLAVVLATAAALAALAALAVPASAARAAGGPAVAGAWARSTADSATTGAAYFTIKGGSSADSLTAASVEKAVAMMATLHKSSMDGMGMMEMSPVKAVAIGAGKTVSFKPGGYHVMLMGLVKPLRAGQRIKLTLTFARSGKQVVIATVRAN